MAEHFLQIRVASPVNGQHLCSAAGRRGGRRGAGAGGEAQAPCAAHWGGGVSGHWGPLLSHEELPRPEICIPPHSSREPPGKVYKRFCPDSAVSWLSPSGPPVGMLPPCLQEPSHTRISHPPRRPRPQQSPLPPPVPSGTVSISKQGKQGRK